MKHNAWPYMEIDVGCSLYVAVPGWETKRTIFTCRLHLLLLARDEKCGTTPASSHTIRLMARRRLRKNFTCLKDFFFDLVLRRRRFWNSKLLDKTFHTLICVLRAAGIVFQRRRFSVFQKIDFLWRQQSKKPVRSSPSRERKRNLMNENFSHLFIEENFISLFWYSSLHQHVRVWSLTWNRASFSSNKFASVMRG